MQIYPGDIIVYMSSRKVTYDNDDYELQAYDGDYFIRESDEILFERIAKAMKNSGLNVINCIVKWFNKYKGIGLVEVNCTPDENVEIKQEMPIYGLPRDEFNSQQNKIWIFL